MVDKYFLVKSQVAFILLFVALASLASANADPPSKTVVNYNVQISESGEQYNETIEVDTEKQTELFKVPAHSNVDHSNILHDFKMNITMMLLPEKKICYYLPLQDGLLTPRKLINSLDTAERTVNKTSKTAIFDNKWIVDREMTNRSVLSDELAAFCAKYPIYYVKKMEDSLTSTRIQTGETKIRKRRQFPGLKVHVSLAVLQRKADKYLEIESVCPGGKGTVTADDVEDCVYNQGKSWKVKCKIVTRTCSKIEVCPTYEYCVVNHLWNRVYCCTYICI